MHQIAWLCIGIAFAACGESTMPESRQSETVAKTLVFNDGTTARFEASPHGDYWDAQIEAGPVDFSVQGTREGNRFTFPRIGCSSQAALKIDLAEGATFSYGLFSVDATVTDNAPEQLHPATGTWAYYANGLTYGNDITTYSIDVELPIAVLGNLLIMPFDLYAWRHRPTPSSAHKRLTIGPMYFSCTLTGELLPSNEFRFFTDDLAVLDLTGEFGDGFTSVSLNYSQPVTQTSRKTAK